MTNRVLLLGGLIQLVSASIGQCQTPDISEQFTVSDAEYRAMQTRTRKCLAERISIKAQPGKHEIREALGFLQERHGFPTVFVTNDALKALAGRKFEIARCKNLPRGAVLGKLLLGTGVWYSLEGDYLEIRPRTVGAQ